MRHTSVTVYNTLKAEAGVLQVLIQHELHFKSLSQSETTTRKTVKKKILGTKWVLGKSMVKTAIFVFLLSVCLPCLGTALWKTLVIPFSNIAVWIWTKNIGCDINYMPGFGSLRVHEWIMETLGLFKLFDLWLFLVQSGEKKFIFLTDNIQGVYILSGW